MSVFTGRKISIYLHVAGWIIVFLLPIFLSTGNRKPDAFFLGQIFIRTAIYGAIFYISYFWLIPQFLFRGKKLPYYLIMILVIVSMYFVNGAITWQLIKRSDFHREQFVEDENKTTANENRRNNSKPPRYPWKFDLYNYLFTSMLVAGFSVGLKMSAKYNENEKRRKELEKEKLSSELAFLKNQVSPHFFFNTLNNIYSLTEINTKEAQNAILKLSKLMRYLLYESERGDV
ncbi:MAG: histidine kinase [Bacteroidales bacterium]|nr:histidine kinase [Bacteroidales bacterium]